MTKAYAVIEKASSKFFAGFAQDHTPMWTDNSKAAFSYTCPRAAASQAILFTRFGIIAQKKPVSI